MRSIALLCSLFTFTPASAADGPDPPLTDGHPKALVPAAVPPMVPSSPEDAPVAATPSVPPRQKGVALRNAGRAITVVGLAGFGAASLATGGLYVSWRAYDGPGYPFSLLGAGFVAVAFLPVVATGAPMWAVGKRRMKRTGPAASWQDGSVVVGWAYSGRF